MKHLIKLPNQDSKEFTEYKIFYSSLVQEDKTRLNENFSIHIEKINNLDDLYKFRAFDDFIDIIISRNLLSIFSSRIESQFLTYLNVVRNVPNKSLAFYYLYNVALKTGLINDHFTFFLESIERLTNEFSLPSDSVYGIYKAAYKKGLLEEQFSKFLKAVDHLSNYAKYHAFAQLINIAVESRLFKNYVPEFLERLDTLPDEYKHRATYQLIDNIKISEVVNRYPEQIKSLTINFIATFEKVPTILKYRAFTELLELLKTTDLLNYHFWDLIEIIENNLGKQKYRALSKLIDLIKKAGKLEMFYDEIKNKFFFFLDDIEKFANLNKYEAFQALLKIEEGTGLIPDYTPICLEMIKKMDAYSTVRYYAYSELLEALKKPGIREEQFPVFLEILATYPSPSNYDAFCSLLEIANKNGLLEDNLTSILKVIMGFYGISKYYSFHEIIKTIESTDLMINSTLEIQDLFQSLLKDVTNLDNCERYYGYITLLKIAKEIGLIKKKLDELLQIIPGLSEIDSLYANEKREVFSSFMEAIKSADLEDEQAFKNWKDKNLQFSNDEYLT